MRASAGLLQDGALVRLRLKPPVSQEVSFREIGSDVLTFDEIFIDEVYRPVLEIVPGCKTVLDIGANIGLASLYFSSQYKGCRVFAVEPNPNTYEVLTQNLSLLVRDGRCGTLQAAVWNRETSLGAFLEDSTHYSGFRTVERTSTSRDDGIPGVSMEAILQRSGFKQVDLLKVDIEGAEVQMFSGDVSWLNRVRAIAIEFHDDSRGQIRFDELMQGYGFAIHDTGHTVVAVRSGSIEK